MDTEREPEAGSLIELDEHQCLELLSRREVGRVAVVVDGRPAIFPVNYALDGDLIVFRTDPGTKLEHGSFDRVAFEVDEIDPVRHEGWSVVIAGVGREVTDALDDASVRELQLELRPWAGGAKQHWIRIISPAITGRRLAQPKPLARRHEALGVSLQLTDAQAADLSDLLVSCLGDLSSEIAGTDNPRYRSLLIARRNNLNDVARQVASAIETTEASPTPSPAVP